MKNLKSKKSILIATLIVAALFALICLLTGCQKYNKYAIDQSGYKPQIKQEATYSKNLGFDVTYEVHLPASYKDNPDAKYPVFYLLPGTWGNSNNWRTGAGLFTNIEQMDPNDPLKECIVVGTEGFNSYYIDKNIKMESFLIDEFMPYISSKYRVNTSKETTFIGGLSMGGYGAAHLALKFPEKFGAAILLSPAVWETPNEKEGKSVYSDLGIFKDANGNFDQDAWTSYHPNSLLQSYAEKNSPVKFYVATGSVDTTVSVETVNAFVNKLQQVADVNYHVVEGKDHEWSLWGEEVINGMYYCLEK